MSEKLKLDINRINHLLDNTYWHIAVSYPQAIHEYLTIHRVKDTEFEEDFEYFRKFIKENGYTEEWNNETFTYFDYEGYKYWSYNTLINRTLLDQDTLSKITYLVKTEVMPLQEKQSIADYIELCKDCGHWNKAQELNKELKEEDLVY